MTGMREAVTVAAETQAQTDALLHGFLKSVPEAKVQLSVRIGHRLQMMQKAISSSRISASSLIN